MKFFNVFAFVCLFLFVIGCDNNVKKLVPEDGNDEDSSEIVDDSDASDTTPEPADTDAPDTTPDTDVPDTDVPDTDSPDTDTPDTESPDEDTSDTEAPEDTCFAAEFNGTDSKIEIPANEALNLASETWTIEAWIKQADEDLNENNVPIVRKGTDTNSPVYLLTGYKKQSYSWGEDNYEVYSLMGYISYSYTSEMGGGGWNPGGDGNTQSATNNPNASNVTYSDDWTHVALVQQKEEDSSNPWQQGENYKLLLFLNGKQVASSDYKANNMNVTPTVNTNDEPLAIGANINANFFFKGLMDSVKISNTAKYSEDFTPAVLIADENTVAFWDFTNNADDSSANALNGVASGVTYVNDCKK